MASYHGQRLAFVKLLTVAMVMTIAVSRSGADDLRIVIDGTTIELSGKVVVEAQDGGVLFRSRDNRLWLVQPDEIENLTRNDDPFVPLDAEALQEQILGELPEGFRVHQTKHYLIFYDTSKTYARWVAGLYERLYRGYHGYWQKKRDWELSPPQGLFPVIIFSEQATYDRFVETELGESAVGTIAYYNLLNNRVIMYDMTGLADASSREIFSFVRQQSSYPMVATVVHEGTHQLMFNTGVQTRLADTPLWVNEGLAMYFETPDVRSSNGWRGIGNVNGPRLLHLRQCVAAGKWISLSDLLTNDNLLREAETAGDAYAASWALTYFLLKRYPKPFVAYLQALAEKQPLVTDTPEERIEQFEAAFGKSTGEIEDEFRRYIRRIR